MYGTRTREAANPFYERGPGEDPTHGFSLLKIGKINDNIPLIASSAERVRGECAHDRECTLVHHTMQEHISRKS
jgi:hypothetical protein